MNTFPELKAGYTVRLHLRISEGKKDRTQIYEGMITSIKGKTPDTRMITVRKEAKGYGVEKIIPLALPTLEKIEIVKTAKVRKARLYYVKNYTKRLKEKMVKQ
ncbi:MAG: 50S ribosomal protein L19 [Patescibacteria group bacterium]|jgi:large subunit ribosomal protein L19